jgi:hypothetical protein
MLPIGVYLTDEVFLYRVVASVADNGGGVVTIEDCYYLDVVHVLVKDLRERRLRTVTPAPIDQAARGLAPRGASACAPVAARD